MIAHRYTYIYTIAITQLSHIVVTQYVQKNWHTVVTHTCHTVVTHSCQKKSDVTCTHSCHTVVTRVVTVVTQLWQEIWCDLYTQLSHSGVCTKNVTTVCTNLWLYIHHADKPRTFTAIHTHFWKKMATHTHICVEKKKIDACGGHTHMFLSLPLSPSPCLSLRTTPPFLLPHILVE